MDKGSLVAVPGVNKKKYKDLNFHSQQKLLSHTTELQKSANTYTNISRGHFPLHQSSNIGAVFPLSE